MTDILDVMAQIRRSFLSANLKAPTTILLESHEEGMRFLSEVRQQCQWQAIPGSSDFGKPVEMADGSIYMECELMGIAVRWPANRTAMPDGSWSYV